MNPASSSPAGWDWKQQVHSATPPMNLRSLARKTALLNYGIALAGLAISWFQRRPDIIPGVAFLVALMSMILWSLTLSFMASVSLYRVILRHRLRWIQHHPRQPAGAGGLADDWLDGPV
jgi:hypothetical protein